MKRHITEAAIDAVADDYQMHTMLAKRSSGELHKIEIEKSVKIVDTFAKMTGQSWINAECMLRKRGTGAYK